MYCVRNVTEDLYWVGANDHRLTLFENIHPIPRGVSYNAYLLLDEHSVLFDTVDWSACRQLLENMDYLLAGKPLDYLVINHMEPDHGASIEEILLRHPKVKVISTEKSFLLMRQFGFQLDGHELIEVKEGDTWSFGRHTVTFVAAPTAFCSPPMRLARLAHWTASCSPTRSILIATGLTMPADILPTSSENTVRMFSFCSKRPPVFWIRFATSVRCTVQSGDRISDTSSTSTITGAATNRKKRVS